MARQEREKSKSGFYHIMIRGNERKSIFLDAEDKLKFIDILGDSKKENRFYLHAFCLMDNHVHLMLCEGTEDVSKIMKRITVRYVHYFNKKYRRVGHLFQDRFRSEVVEDDSYVLMLIRYIHRNPVQAGMVKTIGEYKWSSYSCYLDETLLFNPILDKEMIIGMFSKDTDTAMKFYEEYMNIQADDKFIDLYEEKQVMREDEAALLFEKMLEELDNVEDVIREFRQRTDLSIRKIAAIAKMNKDKVNEILKTKGT